ncbi:Cilia- and flagella-associated protein 77, partial [Varanus komodoensis]
LTPSRFHSFVQPELGKPRRNCYTLPGHDFNYGLYIHGLDGGVPEAIGRWNVIKPKVILAKEQPRDYKTMNCKALRDGFVTAHENNLYRQIKDIRLSEDDERRFKRVAPKVPADMTYGRPARACHDEEEEKEEEQPVTLLLAEGLQEGLPAQKPGEAQSGHFYTPVVQTGLISLKFSIPRPSTPFFELLQHKYQEIWLDQQRGIIKAENEERKEKKRRGKVYDTRTTLLRKFQPPMKAEQLWHMPHFQKGNHQIQAAASSRLLKPVLVVLTSLRSRPLPKLSIQGQASPYVAEQPITGRALLPSTSQLSRCEEGSSTQREQGIPKRVAGDLSTPANEKVLELHPWIHCTGSTALKARKGVEGKRPGGKDKNATRCTERLARWHRPGWDREYPGGQKDESRMEDTWLSDSANETDLGIDADHKLNRRGSSGVLCPVLGPTVEERCRRDGKVDKDDPETENRLCEERLRALVGPHLSTFPDQESHRRATEAFRSEIPVRTGSLAQGIYTTAR